MLTVEWPATSPVSPDGLPYCPTCGGMRRVRSDVPVSHPDFGKLLPCPDCGVQVAQHRRRQAYHRHQAVIAQYSHLIGRALTQTFENFELAEVPRAVQDAYWAALAFAAQPQGFLVLSGGTGTGKSHLAAAIANLQATRPEPCLTLFFIVPDLLDMLRGGYQRGDYEALLTLMRDCELLILDDLGTESQTDWAAEKLFTLVNYRYQKRWPTVFATNCELADLEPRLRSRLMDAGFVQHLRVIGPDYRLTGRAQ